MFSKLALKNVTRSLRDYSVYFITITFGVCIFYLFNSMGEQTVLKMLAGNDRAYLIEAIMTLINVLSVFVSVVLAFLILYANTFLIRRRKRELGTYLLLGMPRGEIAMLLFLETLCIGIFALGVGLLLGVFLSQFVSVFVAGLFALRFPAFAFVFSLPALLKTTLYFSVIFLLVMVYNAFSVTRCKLIDLMQAEHTNQTLRHKSLRASVVMFVLGVILLGVAYTMLLRRGLLYVDALFFLMLGLGTLGTLLFFRSLSGFLLRICQQRKSLYYKGLNMFILRQFNSRINTNYISMTVICLMLLLAIGITACSVGLNNTVEKMTTNAAPYDVSVQIWPDAGQPTIDIPAALTAHGCDVTQVLPHAVPYAIRTAELTPEGASGSEHFEVLSLSDFNALMALQGKRALELAPETYGVLTGEHAAVAGAPSGLTAGTAFTLDGVRYAPDTNAVRAERIATGTIYALDLLILPDAAVAALPHSMSGFAGNYPKNADAEALNATFRAAAQEMLPHDFAGSFGCDTKLDIYMDMMGSKILVLFIGLYLGIIFLLTSAAVLALQQLSQAADNVGRYRVLARLGVEEKMRDRSLYVQIFLSFFLPLALAVIHAVVGMTAANAVIAELGRVDVVASSAVTAVFILVVYGAYFCATCWSSRRIVRSR